MGSDPLFIWLRLQWHRFHTGWYRRQPVWTPPHSASAVLNWGLTPGLVWLYPAGVDDEFLCGAHCTVVGGEEEDHCGDVVRHQGAGQALRFGDLDFGGVVDPQFDLANEKFIDIDTKIVIATGDSALEALLGQADHVGGELEDAAGLWRVGHLGG
jgi:hypothetical protein